VGDNGEIRWPEAYLEGMKTRVRGIDTSQGSTPEAYLEGMKTDG